MRRAGWGGWPTVFSVLIFAEDGMGECFWDGSGESASGLYEGSTEVEKALSVA